jgi:hypothetical protein
MRQTNVFFDVDGTLIWPEGVLNRIPDTPRYAVIDMYRSFIKFGCKIYIWSGGGIDYATR